jgi:hypothetical protein
VIKPADRIIDLGAEGGDAGTPEAIAAEKRSDTGQFLKPVLARAAASKRKSALRRRSDQPPSARKDAWPQPVDAGAE